MWKWPFLFHCLAIANEDQSYWIDQDLAAKKQQQQQQLCEWKLSQIRMIW